MSWIIINKQTGQAITEIFSYSLVKRLNTEKYQAKEAGEYLGELNQQLRAQNATN